MSQEQQQAASLQTSKAKDGETLQRAAAPEGLTEAMKPTTKNVVTYGAHSVDLPLAGYTVEQVRTALAETLNVDETAEAYIDGKPVQNTDVLQDTSRLDFLKESGTKGTQMRNKVVIYSNGIVDFHRKFSLGVFGTSNAEVVVKVRKEYLGDVLSTLMVVPSTLKLLSPPSYSVDEPDLKLSGGSFIDLINPLKGSKIKYKRSNGETATGLLAGTESAKKETVSGIVQDDYVIVLEDNGNMTRRPVDGMINFEFVDQALNDKIRQSLKHEIEAINKSTVAIKFEVESTKSASEGIVRYTVPVAAWKPTYRFDNNKGKLRLDGLAVVNNNTEEDWTDTDISVVIGQPISLETDLAMVNLPARQKAAVVRSRSIGVRSASLMNASAGLESADYESASFCSADGGMQANTTSEEIDDFLVFESKSPVTIMAHHSAVIPLFNETLDESELVLYLKPYEKTVQRAIHFENKSKLTLSTGVATFMNEGLFSGTCILPLTKPEEKQLLPYAVESGVRVLVGYGSPTEECCQVKIANGMLYQGLKTTQEASYEFKNLKGEDFKLILEQNCQFGDDSKLEAGDYKSEKVDKGVRFTIPLEAKTTTNVLVRETHVDYQKVVLTDSSFSGIMLTNPNLVDGVKKSPDFKKCVALQEEIHSLKEEKTKCATEVNNAIAEQNRLKDLVKSVGGSELTERLLKTEKIINERNNETIPQLDKQISNKQKELQKLFSSLVFEWNEK